jgi:hypothetical protein
MRRSIVVLLAVLALASSLSCDNSGTSSSGITTPTTPLTSQTFTGTIDLKSSANLTFTVAVSGEVDVTIASLAPPANIQVGFAIGIPSVVDPTVCGIQDGTTPQVVGAPTTLSGTLAAGSWCVKLSDVGLFSVPVNYTVTVAHS